jgi:DNA-binding MarR family transcriptional regulator
MAQYLSTGLTIAQIVNTIDNMKARLQCLEQLIWELRRAFRELTAAADHELQLLGIEARDRAFLEFLARESEPISLSDLARKYSVSRQHIHQTLRRLPHPEWVEEIPDSADRRAIRLRLSRQGRACWDKVRVVDRALLERLGKRLSQERVVAATDLLRHLRRELLPDKESIDEER